MIESRENPELLRMLTAVEPMDAELVEFWRSVNPTLKLRIGARMAAEMFLRVREVVRRDYPDRDEVWVILECHRRLGDDDQRHIRRGETLPTR
ncbi:MAG: hypothetical protein ACKVZJ_07740 [Phycisphaerales bacterium]